jgi:predicted nuclease of predicted toxin-antitoxin system
MRRRLIGQLADLFPGSVHVSSEQLLQASDIAVWEYAKSFGFSIITADADFYELAITLGAPPKVVWLKGCDYPTAVCLPYLCALAHRASWVGALRAGTRLLRNSLLRPDPSLLQPPSYRQTFLELRTQCPLDERDRGPIKSG